MCFDAEGLDAASKELALRTVVFFGSHATHEPPPGAESDVDVAISFAVRGERPSFWDAHEVRFPAFRGLGGSATSRGNALREEDGVHSAAASCSGVSSSNESCS